MRDDERHESRGDVVVARKDCEARAVTPKRVSNVLINVTTLLSYHHDLASFLPSHHSLDRSPSLNQLLIRDEAMNVPSVIQTRDWEFLVHRESNVRDTTEA